MRLNMDLEEKASKLGIKYFLLAYSNLNTNDRICLVLTGNIKNAQKDGICFTPEQFFSIDINNCDFRLFPDPESFIQLPWKKEFAWVQSDIYLDGSPYSQCPRNALKKQVEKAKDLGYIMMAGFEPEFMLLEKNDIDRDSIGSHQRLSLHDGHPIMRNSKLLSRISESMEVLGWKPYQIFHEASECQYEINFGYSQALTTADRHCFFKFLVKELAEAEGYTATFMPTPTMGLVCANGLHINVSLWSLRDGVNLFPDETDKELGISKLARHFIGGLLEHVQDSCAVLCPTVNSYKRTNAGSWVSNVLTWSGNNKSAMIRVPISERIEHRLPDGSSNLHLALALILAAGLEGVTNGIDPGSIFVTNAISNKDDLKKVPNNLYEALNIFKSSIFVENCLGRELVEAFVFLKMREWNLYSSQLTKWEKEFYLNC